MKFEKSGLTTSVLCQFLKLITSVTLGQKHFSDVETLICHWISSAIICMVMGGGGSGGGGGTRVLELGLRE